MSVTHHENEEQNKVSDLEETIQRIKDHEGVMGMMVINPDGVAVRTTMDSTHTNSYSAILSRLTDQARSAIRDLDPLNEVTFIRLRSRKNEILIAPDKEFNLIVVQTPADVESNHAKQSTQ
ncbi:dynein light chain roadblock-type 2-like isoform X1 [Tigriopus californicus]|nr:dynein light chain roadblock-type 2-like isoform X1 [Tigriopus californicus]